jgi:hypothetical protein
MRPRTAYLLLFIAVLLQAAFFPVGRLVTYYAAWKQRKIGKVTGYLAKSALARALSIDTMGNTVCRDLLTMLLLRQDELANAYPFGNYTETISRVLGKNKALGTLSATGLWLANLLNRIDPNHVENAARD